MGIEDTSTASSGASAGTQNSGNLITPANMQQMLDILENITDHTHVVYDDYSTACNCNCACDCGRGSM